MSYASLERHFGTSAPISLAPGTEADEKCSATMQQVLADWKVFETEEQGRKREIILSQLEGLIQDWVRDESINAV